MKIKSTKLDFKEMQEIAEMARLSFSEGIIECYPDDLIAVRQCQALMNGEEFSPLPNDEMYLKLQGLSSYDSQMAALLGEDWEQVW